MHDHLPAEAAYEFARILRQLWLFYIAFLFSLLPFFQCCHQAIKKLATKQPNFAQSNGKSRTLL